MNQPKIPPANAEFEDRVLTRMLGMPPDPKVVAAKAKKTPAKKLPKK
jgi:hypothetical protein